MKLTKQTLRTWAVIVVVFILLVIAFTSCQKTEFQQSPIENNELVYCEGNITPEMARIQIEKETGYSLERKRPTNPCGGRGNKPCPTDTIPDPDPDPNPDPDPTPDPDPVPDPPTDPTAPTVCIYLKADGFVNTVPEWMMQNNGLPLVSAASLLSEEKLQSAEDSVKYYYRDYRVLVTRDQTVYDVFPLDKTIVVLTPRHWSADRFNTTGLAYPGSLRRGTGSVCYVFTSALFESGAWAGKIAGHESGHTFGLHHQKEYTSGGQHVNNYINVALMGQCYYSACPWIYGIWWWAYPEAPMYQDDKAIIAARAGYR